MSAVYGPVPSWRFGRSLGIDVIAPPKKCTLNCIYCQLGETKIHVSDPEMLKGSLASANKILSDLDDVLGRIDFETVDIVTFSGCGEPTLNLELGEIAKKAKAKIGAKPMAILTNSSLFYRPDVRRNLTEFDLVVAKLDAGNDEAFRLINRPANKEPSVQMIIESIRELKRKISGRLALEVMLLEAEDGRITNVSGENLKDLIKAVAYIEPDIVQLEVPYRPPSKSWVKQPSQKRLRQISTEISEILGEEKVWAYGIHDRRGRSVTWQEHDSVEREVLDLLRRRPCRAIDVAFSLGIDLLTAQEVLKKLRERDQIDMKLVDGTEFFSKKQSRRAGNA